MPSITQGVLPILLAPGLNPTDWEFGYYQLQSVNEVFDIDRVSNWSNSMTFRGIADGYYYVVARMKAQHLVFDYKKELVACSTETCVLRILNATKTPSASGCTLRIIAATKTPAGGGGVMEGFFGLALFGTNI